MSANHPTIKEIALRLNVSKSTVSRALHDHPRIGLKTKERVKELAREMKYEPNAQAIFFKQQKTAVNGPANLSASRERLEGYKQAFSQKKMKIDMRYYESTDLTKEGTTNAIKKLLSLKNRPSAIIRTMKEEHIKDIFYHEEVPATLVINSTKQII